MSETIEYYDISPEIDASTAVWPGDVAFERNIALDFKKGDNLILSSIKMTLHMGAHADAPNHYHPDGFGIDSRPPRYYMGDCQVIHVDTARGERIRVSHLKGKKIKSKRVLFSTGSFPDPKTWNIDFCALSAELVKYLAEKGVILVGIDTPSIDLIDDKSLESHNAIYEANMAVLEGLLLSEVPEGNYFLMALPLKIKDADASPVRAVLVSKGLKWTT